MEYREKLPSLKRLTTAKTFALLRLLGFNVRSSMVRAYDHKQSSTIEANTSWAQSQLRLNLTQLSFGSDSTSFTHTCLWMWSMYRNFDNSRVSSFQHTWTTHSVLSDCPISQTLCEIWRLNPRFIFHVRRPRFGYNLSDFHERQITKFSALNRGQILVVFGSPSSISLNY